MSESSANNRDRLITIPVVILLGVIVVFLLTLLFPSKSTFEDTRYIENPDLLSIAYLKAVFKLTPSNIKLRLTLAKQFVSINKWQDALALVENYSFLDRKNEARAKIIYLKIYLAQYEELKKNDPLRKWYLKQARSVLKNITISMYDKKVLIELANTALGINRPDYASNIYKHLAETDLKNTAYWWSKAGKWARASKYSEFASLYYFNAYKSAKKTKKAVVYASLSVISAIDSDQHDAATKYLNEYLTVFPNNKYFLETTVMGYRVLKDLGKETQWNKKLWLQYGQEDEKITLRQLELEVAVGDLKQARLYSIQLVSLNNNNRKYRQQLAQLEEWTGQPIAAQKQWEILATTSDSTLESEHVLRLAIMNYDDPAIISSLNDISKKRNLTLDEQLKKITTYERQGEIELTQVSLEAYLNSNPDNKEKWFFLAKLYENQNNYEGAIRTWMNVEKHYPRELVPVLQQVKLHWIYQSHDKAYKKTKRINIDFNEINSVEYLEILSELGRRYNDNELLKKSSYALLRRDDKNELAYTNLLLLAKERKAIKKAVNLAETAWKKTNKIFYIRMALEVAVGGDDRRYVDYLIELAFQKNISGRATFDYILIMADFENNKKNYYKASVYYEYAIKLNPSSKLTHVGLLWSLVNSNQRIKLKYYLGVFKAKANQFSLYWPVYSAATLMLGESQESVYWHSKLAKKNPDNYLWVLSYADALEAAEHYDAAFKIRLYVVNKIRTSTGFTLVLKKSTQQLVSQYLILENKLGLTANSGILVKAVASKSYFSNNALLYDFLLKWHLSQNEDEMSRLWHFRQQQSRMKISDSQSLALALNGNNVDIIRSIVSRESDISLVDKIEGLTRLGYYENALALSIEAINVFSNLQERKTFRLQAAALASKYPNYWSTNLRRYENGTLLISTISADYKVNIHNWNYGLSMSNNKLYVDNATVNLVGNNSENDFGIDVKRVGRQFNVYSQVKINQRDDKDILSSMLAVNYSLSKQINTKFLWKNNQLSFDSNELRVLGTKNEVQLALNANVGREYLNLQFASLKYQSRWSEPLAQGWSSDVAIGHRLSIGRNEWTVQLNASKISNTLKNILPNEVSQRVPNASATSLLVANDYSTLGISMRLSRGNIKSAYPQNGSIRYYVDTWLGKSYPANVFAYRFSSGLGTRVVGNDELSFEFVIDQIQNKVGNQSSVGIKLSYRSYIGR